MSARAADTTEDIGDVAIDVVANDLVHIGQDTDGRHHYHDKRRERILVVGVEHEEYSRDGSALVRRRLVAGAEDVQHVHEGVTPETLVDYLQFVRDEVDGLDWQEVALTVLGSELLDVGPGGRA